MLRPSWLRVKQRLNELAAHHIHVAAHIVSIHRLAIL